MNHQPLQSGELSGIRYITCTRLLELLAGAGLLPLLILSWFDYPAADDFSMGLEAGLAMRSTGSVTTALLAGLTKTIHLYQTWIGYFTSALLSALPPHTWGEGWYRLTAPIALCSLCLGTALLLHHLLTRRLGVDPLLTRAVTAMTLFITLQCMPDQSARVEGFFWYCGSINYTFMYGLGLVWLSQLLILGDTAASGRLRLRTLLSCLLGFAVGGGNYMTALTCAMVAVLTILYAFLGTKSLPLRLRLILPCLCQLAGFAVSCLAPGNAVRASGITGFSAIRTVFIALYYVLSVCISQWSGWAVLLLLMITAPMLWHAAAQTRLSFRLPGIVVILAWGFVAANIAPPLYATGSIEAGRIRALFWMQYILLLILTEGYLLGWLQRQLVQRISGETSSAFSRQTSLALLLLALFFLFGAALQTKVDPHYFTAGSAVTDLISGSAVRYAAQNTERWRLLTDPAAEQVVLPPYTDRPALLFFSDITNDPSDWTNQALARYYGKKSVRIP